MDERNNQFRQLFHLLGLYPQAEEEVDDGLEDGMVELHDFFVSFPEDEGVELVGAVYFAELSEYL